MRTLYLNPSRREQEKSFFKAFCSTHKEFNIENPEEYRKQPPNPDYIFPLSKKRIGLELTTLVLNKPGLVLDKSGELSSLAAIRDAQNKCLKKAAQIVKRDGLPSVTVEVEFRSDINLALIYKITIDEAVKELVDFLEKKIPTIDDTKTWHYYESGLKYSKWISIRLGTFNGQKLLDHHRFMRNHKNWVTMDPIDGIQSGIDKKQSKYTTYIQNCDECWLLIGVDEWTKPEAAEIREKTKNHVFSGDFQRLFFLRNIEGTLTELKIKNR